MPIYEGFVVADSESGNRVLLNSIQPLPIDNVMPFGNLRGYLSERRNGGWSTTTIGLPITPFSGSMARDGSYVIDTLIDNVDPDDENVGGIGGREDVYLRNPGGELVWISRDRGIPVGTPHVGDQSGGGTALGAPSTSSMSVDGTTLVFEGQNDLLELDTTGDSFTRRLYRWTDDGTALGDLQFIGVRPNGSVPNGGSGLAEDGEKNAPSMQVNSVSADGSRIVFHASGFPGDHGQRYLHIDGESPRQIAKATGVPPIADPQQVSYVGADRDLNRVFFTSTSRLTPDSGAGAGQADLYVYDVESDAVQDLTPRLDGGTDPEVDPLPEDQARVRGVAGFSDDGKRIFFVADGQLDTALSPEGDLPDGGGNNLYMAELDEFGDPVEVAFITTLSDDDADLATGDWEQRTAYSSPDGEVLGFGATTNLTDTDIGGLQQVFAYDAGEHLLECASCPADGSSPTSAVNLTTDGPRWQHNGGEGIKRWVSSDGSVLFHTATRLSTHDHNDVEDVYLYRDGERHLISGGAGEVRSRMTGASRDGSTIFFVTGDALVPDDDEPGILKIYAAVSEGGFASEGAPEPPCEGDDCQGEATPAPAGQDPGSSHFEGQGNPAAQTKDCSSLDQRAKKLRQRAKKLNRKAKNAPRATKRAKRLKRKAKKAKRDGRQAVRRARACKSGDRS